MIRFWALLIFFVAGTVMIWGIVNMLVDVLQEALR